MFALPQTQLHQIQIRNKIPSQHLLFIPLLNLYLLINFYLKTKSILPLYYPIKINFLPWAIQDNGWKDAMMKEFKTLELSFKKKIKHFHLMRKYI